MKDSTAYYWMKTARAARIPEFARVLPRSETPARVAVEIEGAVIRLESGFDAELLLEVMSVLRRQSA